MKKVLVLMSTYNGDRYLIEQLNSIFNQEDVDINCLIRDDGSTDRTKELILEYQKNQKKLKYVFEKNIGWAESFFKLIEISSNDYDYYAFSDQDDFWIKDKISSAIKKIEDYKDISPALYFSNLKIVDKELKWQKSKFMNKKIFLSKSRALVENVSTGCTQVFNLKLKKLLQSYKPIPIRAHDHWVYLVSIFLGKVFYDPYSYILYRQHESNTLGAIKNPFKIFYKRFKIGFNIFNINKYQQFKKMSLNLLNGYYSKISQDDLNIISKVAYYDTNIKRKLLLLIDNKVSRNGFILNFGLKIRILLGLL